MHRMSLSSKQACMEHPSSGRRSAMEALTKLLPAIRESGQTDRTTNNMKLYSRTDMAASSNASHPHAKGPSYRDLKNQDECLRRRHRETCLLLLLLLESRYHPTLICIQAAVRQSGTRARTGKMHGPKWQRNGPSRGPKSHDLLHAASGGATGII